VFAAAGFIRPLTEPLKKILADTLGVREGDIGDNASTETLSSWDSVAHLNIVLSVEAAYGVSFTPEEIAEMTSLEKIKAALTKRGVVPN
jgi:acyl carrier protein